MLSKTQHEVLGLIIDHNQSSSQIARISTAFTESDGWFEQEQESIQ